MTSIGRRCRGGNAYSRAILITRTLSVGQTLPEKTTGSSKDRKLFEKALVLKLRLPSWHLFLRNNVKRVRRDPEDDGKKKLRW